MSNDPLEFFDSLGSGPRYGGRYVPRKIAEPNSSRVVTMAVSAFVAVIVGGSFLALWSRPADKPAKPSPHDTMIATARRMAKEQVLQNLTHPLDASFPAVPEVTTEGDDSVFRVESTVKAKNGFGGELTYRWKVVLVRRQEDRGDSLANQWSAISCDIDNK